MRLKTYTAASMPEAMKMVRIQMGEDAVIMATKHDKKQNLFIVTAGIDDEAFATPKPATTAATSLAAPPVSTSTQPIEDHTIDAIAEALDRHGSPRRLTHHLLRNIEDSGNDPVTAMACGLQSLFSFGSLLGIEQRKPLLLIGTPGAGKTLTIAKLATKAVMQRRKVSVITCDTLKAGGVEQLSTLTRILNVPLHTVEDADGLRIAIDQAPDDALLLIDSPGINPFNMQDIDWLYHLTQAELMDTVMVQPSGIDALEAAEITAALAQKFRPQYLLITKLDMARRLGSMLASAYESRLKIVHAGMSSNVVDGLVDITPMLLARLLLHDVQQPKINLFVKESIT